MPVMVISENIEAFLLPAVGSLFRCYLLPILAGASGEFPVFLVAIDEPFRPVLVGQIACGGDGAQKSKGDLVRVAFFIIVFTTTTTTTTMWVAARGVTSTF